VTEPCRELPWDTAFFHRRTARVIPSRLTEDTLAAVLRWSAEHSVQWLHFLADCDHAETVWLATRAGFDFTDTRLTLRLEGPARVAAPALPAGVIVRPSERRDVPELKSIAASAHTHSRFFYDRCLPAADARRLFETWIERSCLHEIADHVVVAEHDGRVVGYVTARIHPDGGGRIGLVGVDEQARGHGLGLAMAQTMLLWLEAQGCPVIDVVTQGRNIAARRIYERCGFMSYSVQLWYHRWFT
jgi:RimJ/RimL family protein N-acetyltransferase